MPRGVVLILWAALVVAAALSTEGGGSSASGAVNAYVQRLVLPTEAGDVFYFASGGQAGAVNAFGQVLWSVRGELIASDPMGSCLAVASALRNGTVFLGTSVALYTPDGRPLWNATVSVAATALATNCVEVAVGGIDGSLYTLRDGGVAGVQRHGSPIYALAYRPDGTLAVGTGDPVNGFTAYVDRCGNSITAVKTDAPYLVVNSPRFGQLRHRGGLAPMLRPPAAASQDCRTFVYAVYDTIYNGASPLIKLPGPVISLAVSGDGRTVAAATADTLYIIRNGSTAAALHIAAVRSIALSWDGLSMAYAADSAMGVQRFKLIHMTASGCPLPVQAQVGNYTYALPAAAYVPADAAAVTPLPAQSGDLLCMPLANSTPLLPHTVVQYRLLYAVRLGPPAQGPAWASGPAAYYAPSQIKIPADQPLGEVRLVLAGWIVNGTARAIPAESITLHIGGPTSAAPAYYLLYPREVVRGNVKYVVTSVTLFDASGLPIHFANGSTLPSMPAYAKVQHEEYFLLAWSLPGNSSTAWLRRGAAAVLTAPQSVELGNGTRLVFQSWSNGEKSPTITAGPGTYAANYSAYYLVSFKATNYTHVQWVPRGAKVNPPDVHKAFDNGAERILIAGWKAPDGTQAKFPYVANAPANFTAVERVEYFATVVDWGEEKSGWYPRGYELPAERRYILWVARWEPSPVINAPGTYKATYQIDPPAAAILLLAAAAAAVAYKRR